VTPQMTQDRLAPLLVLIASVAVAGGALLFQYVGHLPPCELCLYQRWPYYAAIPLALVTLLAGRRQATLGLLALCVLLFLAGGALAFYHVGVEQHWFAGPTTCTGSVSASGSVEDFTARLLATPPVRCDEIAWSLFGISLAGWNFLASFGLVVFCIAALRVLARAPRAA
jgi:disulfide bond formation protein DsbB